MAVQTPIDELIDLINPGASKDSMKNTFQELLIPSGGTLITSDNITNSVRKNSLPRLAIGALMGHSFAARSHISATNGIYGREITKGISGAAAWLEALSNGRISMPASLNFGVNGENTTQMRARLDTAVSSCVSGNADFVIFFGLCNDVLATAQQRVTTTDNITAIAKAFTDAGILFIISGDAPAGGNSDPTYRRPGDNLKGFMAVRRWCLESLPSLVPGVLVYDIYDKVSVPNSTTGDALPAFFQTDLLHPSSQFYTEAVVPAILPQLLSRYPSIVTAPEASNSEPYDSVINPRGNILFNGMMDGDNSGLATSWSTPGGNGVTTASSKVSSVDGPWAWQQIVLSGSSTSAGGETQVIQQQLNASQLSMISAGDKIQLDGLVELDSGFTNIRNIAVRFSIFESANGGNTYTSRSFSTGSVGLDKLANRSYKLYQRTPVLEFPQGSLTSGLSGTVRVIVVADTAGSISGTIRVGRMRLHKIIS